MQRLEKIIRREVARGDCIDTINHTWIIDLLIGLLTLTSINLKTPKLLIFFSQMESKIQKNCKNGFEKNSYAEFMLSRDLTERGESSHPQIQPSWQTITDITYDCYLQEVTDEHNWMCKLKLHPSELNF